MKALIAAAQEPDPVKRMARLDQVLDVDRFMAFIAMEVMTWHWDGYAMKRNNYRVYHDPSTDKIVFFAHGMDQMFWEPDGSIVPPNRDGLVARAIWETTVGRRRYRECMGTLLTNIFKVEALTNRINEVQRRIRPVLAAINPGEARNHDDTLNKLRNAIAQRAVSIARQLSVPESKPVRFDDSGRAILSAWRQQNQLGAATLDKVAADSKLQTLHIRAGADGHCTASWRTKVLLEPARYRFEGQVRTAGVVPLSDLRGEGAGLRISHPKAQRLNKASGDSPWQKLEYEFSVPSETSEIELVCELRAAKGEAWFDPQSLQLVRLSK